MPKSLDTSITTIKNFKHATKDLKESMQIFVQLTGHGDDDSALIEITEIQAILPKDDNADTYLVLRSK